MRKPALLLLVASSAMAFAQGPAQKAGLWEMKQTSLVVDGQDRSAQMSAARVRMQQALAKMPPEQRKRMEAMMGGQNASAGGGIRICISPAMAAREKPMVDPNGTCQPGKVSRSGNSTTFEFNCTADGRTSAGKGKTVVNGDTVATHMDMTVTDATGRHTTHSESQMKYLGPDCKGIKPADQLAKEAPARSR